MEILATVVALVILGIVLLGLFAVAVWVAVAGTTSDADLAEGQRLDVQNHEGD
ncbi:MAG TPA: hypothetical protein VEW95_05550 [Candidatus Limnocylindrales bacterium]|nr:hypothetical protein [Candidatus Limnocylindrales bacterium]